MIGRLNPRHREVWVIGGGVSGLLAAYRLARAGWRVQLHEKTSRLGGVIRTLQTPYGIAETAAHSLKATPAVFDLLRQLDVPYLEVNPRSRARYILRGGTLRKFPLSAGEFFSLAKRAVLTQSMAPAGQTSVEDWARLHLGEPALRYLVDPMIAGIYACSPRELALRAAFPNWEVEPGRTFIGQLRAQRTGAMKAPMIALKDGMHSLVEALELKLRESNLVSIHLESRIESIESEPNAVITVPTHSLRSFLRSPDLIRKLERLRSSPLVTATVFLSSSIASDFQRGVGFLCPSTENREVLGVLFNSFCFEGRANGRGDAESFTVMMGGTSRPEIIDWDDARIIQTIERELSAIFKKPIQLSFAQITRWKEAIPVYSRELMEFWQTAAETDFKASFSESAASAGRVLFSNYSGQVSLRGLIETSRDLVPTV